MSLSADKETCGATQTLRPHNAGAHVHKQRQMRKFTHMFGDNGWPLSLQLEPDIDADVPFQNEVTSRPASDTGSPRGGGRSVGQQSHVSASDRAAVPAVFRNLSYSTHSWRSPHMTP